LRVGAFFQLLARFSFFAARRKKEERERERESRSDRQGKGAYSICWPSREGVDLLIAMGRSQHRSCLRRDL
jgi:hypothetical protein